MHALRSRLIQSGNQIQVDLLRHERDHGCGQLRQGNQSGIERHISVDLILLHSFGPEAFAAPSHIPVAAFIHKILQSPCRFRDLVSIQPGIHFRNQGIQAAQKPLIHHGKLIVFQFIFRSIEFIDIRIQDEKRVGIPQRSHELPLAFDYRLAMEAAGKPGRAAGIEIPADRIRTVFLQRFKGIHRIALGFAHLLSVLILYQPQHDHVFKRGLIEQQRGLRQKGIEPAAGLIHRLRDKLSGELLFKDFLIFKRIMMLRKRHGPRIEPAVNHFRHTLHHLAAVRTRDCDGVDIRAVQFHSLRFRVAA